MPTLHFYDTQKKSYQSLIQIQSSKFINNNVYFCVLIDQKHIAIS